MIYHKQKKPVRLSDRIRSLYIIFLILNIILCTIFFFRKEIMMDAIKRRNVLLSKAMILISGRKDFSARDWWGYTPLHLVAREGNYDLAKLLISKGANIHARTYIIPMKGQPFSTPLHIAAQENRKDIAKLLKAHGAVVNARNLYDYTPFHYSNPGIQEMLMIHYDAPAMDTSLPVDNLRAVISLLSKGMDINKGRGTDMTLLHRTIGPRYMGYEWSETVPQYLIWKGADINAVDSSGTTPLGRAVISESKEAVEFLINHNAELNTQDNTGMTPLHYAADSENREIMLLLLNSGADKKIRDYEGRPPLSIAMARNHREIVKVLRGYK